MGVNPSMLLLAGKQGHHEGHEPTGFASRCESEKT